MMQVRNTQGKKFIRQQKFLGANIVSCNMILGLPWLYVLKAYVTWEIGEFYFFSDTPFALPVREVLAYGATKIGIPDPNTIGAVADQALPDIVLVSKIELYCICKREGVQAFLVE